jgi:predicted DNA-binding transcriptional regulator YafY
MLRQDGTVHYALGLPAPMSYRASMKTEESYGKFLDMLDLALMLQATSYGVGLSEIMDRFGIARRTAERMRNALANYFGPYFEEIRDGQQKRFKLRSPSLDKLTSFNREELAAFSIAAKILRKNNLHAKADALDSAFLKLKSLSNPKISVVNDVEDMIKAEGLALRPGPKIRHDGAIIRILREAILSFHQVRIRYDARSGKSGPHTLVPLGFLYGERNHYLVASYADDGEKTPIHFILGRIKEASLLDDTFEEDTAFSLEAHAAKSFGAYQEEPFAVEWRFSPEAADEAERFIFHPGQTMRRNQDGSLTVVFTAGGRLEMAWHLYTWGEHVRVIQPADFWQTLPKI